VHYKVKKLSYGKGWALYVWHEGKEKFVREGDWPPGLKPNYDLAEARDTVKSLNARWKEVQKETSAATIRGKLRAAAQKQCAWLPADVVSHFERLFIEPRRARPGFAKIESMWVLVQKLILEVNLDPQDWALEPSPFYEWWTRNPHSLDYVRRCLKMLSQYGHLFARKRGTPFSPVAPPPEPWRTQIADAFAEVGEKKSAPLLEADFLSLRSKLLPEQYAWVSVAWAFGLRPEEVDIVAGPKKDNAGRVLWDLEAGDVLLVYQPKLIRTPRRERYKRIPTFTEYQRKALAGMKGMQRPSLKTVNRAFPEGVTLYGCRHGFTRYMEEIGQPIDKVSKWLGHRSRATTERYYRDHGLLARPEDEKAA
jgi:hypothetical protein